MSEKLILKTHSRLKFLVDISSIYISPIKLKTVNQMLHSCILHTLFIYFIYTLFQEGYIFSSIASLPYGPLDI